MSASTELEAKVEEHSIQIQELKDEISFKRWKIETVLEKIDDLTKCVQQIQVHQLKDDSDIKERVTSIESSISTLKWVIGIGLSVLGLISTYVLFFISHL